MRRAAVWASVLTLTATLPACGESTGSDPAPAPAAASSAPTAGGGAEEASDEDAAAAERRIKLATGLLDELAFCLTVLVGADRDDVLDAWGVDRAAEAEPLSGLWDEPEYPPALAVLDIRGAAVAVEPNGYFGNLRDVLGPASVGRRAASLYAGNDGEAFLALAEDGVIRFQEEYLEDLDDVEEDLAELFDGLPWAEAETWEASALVVLERFTGVRIEGPPPAEPMMVYRLPEEWPRSSSG
jgi:hypothetical protein